MDPSGDHDARRKRLQRIQPFLPELKAEREPKTNKAVLLVLVQDLKDEGNCLFKEGKYQQASTHYKQALFVAGILEERYYHEVANDFLTTLHANGALSYLKTNKFAEALYSSTEALKLQPQNVKAQYRKVQALIGLKRYKEALAEAQDGMAIQPSVFKDSVNQIQEVLAAQAKSSAGGVKSATASASAYTVSPQGDASNEWLAETNALKTEKQRKAALKKMPRKKKPKNPQPVVSQRDNSSDSDVDSDSSDPSDDNQFAAKYASVRQTGFVGRAPAKKGENYVRVTPHEPDTNADVLTQSMGFRTVGQSNARQNGMGLDDFGLGHHSQRSKSQGQKAPSQRLPPVDIEWPLDEDYQFRVACRLCFVKTGEGYKGYNLLPNYSHLCDKDVLVIRRRDNQSLNWIKIRPFPNLFNSRFSDFKMCQQFINAMPCKIGEPRCTFPHNSCEMKLWYMERDRTFSVTAFLDELRKHGIETSEQLAARRSTSPAKHEPQQIPGLNFKEPSRQRFSSPAPVEQPPRHVPVPINRPPPSSSYPAAQAFQPGATAGPPPTGVQSPPRMPPGFPSGPPPNKPTHMPMNRMPPPPQRPLLQQPLVPPTQASRPPPFSPPTGPQPNVAQSALPLKDYDYKIVCPACFPYDGFPGRYKYNPHTHECEENVLAVRRRNVPNSFWVRVRERTNHRDFFGRYIICHSVIHGRKDACRYGEAHCSFAHNEAEQMMWALEKDGKFSITEFILQNRNVSSRGFSFNELMKKHPGYFTFVCRGCFFSRPPRVSEEGPDNTCTGAVRHRWDQVKVLAHVSASGQLTIVDQRKFTSKSAFFRICKFLHFCHDQVNGACLSAHSMLERDVWMLERDTDISREQIVQQSRRRPQHGPPPQQQQQQAPPSQAGAARPGPASSPQSQFAPAATTAQSGKPGREKVPYTVQEYCGTCWRGGIKSLQDGSANRCVKRHPNFELNKVVLILPIFKELRNLPHTIPRNLNFVLCRYIQERRKCQFVGSVPCQFAHSDEERVLWIWMARNNASHVRDVVKACREDQQKVKINQGDSVVAVTASRPATQTFMPPGFQNNTHYCRYCSIQCNSDRQWEEHCASDKHTFNVNSDKDHQWNYRQPPWGQGNNLDICSKHMDGQRCQYSHVPDMFNLCKYAHSPEELDEWRERYEWRQMKRTLAKEQNMFSYMDNLLDQYNSADSRVTVMSESLDGVSVTCSTPLEIFKQEKNAVVTWTFIIKTQRTLEKVALLHHSARLHFHLQCADGSKHQIAAGEQFEDVDSRGHPCFIVNVHFSGGMFGSFSQWVAFDFGTKPVLLRKLNVELGHEMVHEKVRDLRQMLAFDRWTTENREVISYMYTYDDLTLSMLQKYKEPASSETVVTQDSIRELNEHNYVHKMHRMLELEEITRHRLISSFNLVTEAEVMNMIDEKQKGNFFARNGELFMKLRLSENLSEDTSSGKLILTSVRSVLLCTKNQSSKRRVYEAQIFSDENFNYDGRGKDYVYLCLSPVCVKELNLSAGQTVEVEVQFQMNRLHFVRMHYALDAMTSTDIVFPDVSKINPFNEEHVLRVQSRVLNDDQIHAVRHIVAERKGYTPPFIMYGPFGTGKTETLAQAAMLLLREKPQSRILICAQSNSAADLYILKHLDPYLKKSQTNQTVLLRIVSKERRLTSVPADVKKFCCLSADGQSFEIPSEQIVRQHRVVVTTVEMSLQLTCMNLRGFFTHIFIDEAAQALECETIMPLILATDRTCVVLTGDHMQISPRVYSPEARRQGFGMSLLERLYLYYEAYSHHMEKAGHSPLNIFLSINYRTKMEILRFISAIFYGGPDMLKAYGNIPSVVELTPLVFHAVQGKEVQESDSTSFYNHAEATEVVERVMELVYNWPMEWGECVPEEIGIVTPYHDQVKQIRHILRSKRGRPELRRVKVETVQNMQGKEFRALFITTVRTWHLLESEHLARALEEAEYVGGVADFAFLSDPKLLNTALTRTQAMVAVVGDPVALCAIGECIQIWRTYLKHCTNMNSVYPRQVNYDSVRNQVVHLQMSHLGPRLKEVTDLVNNKNTVPRSSPRRDFPVTKLMSGSKKSETLAFTDNGVDDNSGGDAEYHPSFTQQPHLASNGFEADVPPKAAPQSKVKVTKVFSVDEKDTDFPIKPDTVLLQLANESLGIETPTQPLKVECISVKLENGIAVLTYDESLTDEGKRQKILAAASAGKEFDSDVEIFSDTDEDTESRQVYYNYTPEKLQQLLHEDAARYKLCTIHIKADYCRALVQDPLDPVQEIEVLGSLCRGLAFDGDEVVVEILTPEDEGGNTQANGAVHGKVMGIMQRAVDPCYQSFVCSADSANTALLTPVNPGIPRIFNVSVQKHTQRVKKGFVSVYELGTDDSLKFSHYEKVEANDPEAKLFIVRYLKWLPGFFSPLGVVVGVIPAGRDLTSALHIVDIEHHIPRRFPPDVDRASEEVYHARSRLSVDAQATRENLTDRWCFTIDSANSQDLQHAFSVEQVSETVYEVSVHISDVAHYVERGTAMDQEAMRRGATILPIGREPVYMLPERLSTELCSLQTGADRLAVSITMTVAASGEEWHVAQTTLRQTIINSKQHLALAEVERILGDMKSAENDYLQSCVLVLYQIAHMHRKQRKGNAHLDPELSPQQMTTPNAYRMVQELLVMANHQVAEQLLRAFPQCTPLLHQAAPNPEKLEVWKSKHAADAINSVALTKPFLNGDKVCTCRMVCMCVFSYMRDQEVKPLEHFDVLTELWKQLVQAATVGHQDSVQKAVASPDNHPQPSVAVGELQAICQPPKLICSGNVDPTRRGHYSLNLPCMTNATNPLRNYISIVVLRMVKALLEGRNSPYSPADTARLVSTCNRTQSHVESFTTADTTVHLAAALQARPLVLFPVVDGLSEDSLHLRFPTMPYIPEKDKTVELSSLGPSAKPQLNAEAEQVKVMWQERIYDNAYAGDYTPPSSSRVNEVVELCADRFVSHIPPFHWQKLLAAVREESAEKLQTIVPAMKEHVQESITDGRFAADVSSEVKRSGHIQHFAEFSMSLHTCMVIQVQVAAELCRGVLSPRLQLLSLTPQLDVCLEHQDNPEQCFAKVTTMPATSLSYSDEISYQERWMPVLALEAANVSVSNQESTIIHRVPIVWTQDDAATPDSSSIVGEFSLQQAFCQERQIVMDTLKAGSDLASFGLHKKLVTPLDLLCVRYSGLQIPDEPALDERVSSMVNTGCSVCWVGHCVVQEVYADKLGLVQVRLRLHSAAMKMPEILLDHSVASELPCTIEWIPRAQPYRKMEYSLACLRDSSELARDIATGRRPVNTIDQADVAFLLEKQSSRLNNKQKTAIETSLKQPFTVIQGGPGTGKTMTVAHLAIMLVERNRMTPQPTNIGMARTQVLICGPSDKAIDAVAVHLMSLGHNLPKIVRVYDEEVESLLFPVPRDTIPPRKKKLANVQENSRIQNISLHHLIRDPGNFHSQKIAEFDSLFALYPHDITDDQVKEYCDIVLKAQLLELKQAEIVLATCCAASSPRMAAGTNIRQIIIDDCGACKEPESLVPVILHRKAQQVVIVGDEKQLQPTVLNLTARSLGLERSLCERYADRAIVLREQYRMHQGICDFPSMYYEGKLVSVMKSQVGPAALDIWPNGPAQPIAFCHIVGREESETVLTENGVEKSMFNAKEVETVVDVVGGLVQQHGVSEERIVVITQYAAQCQHIRQQLAQRNLQVLVNTVPDCQGHEYDYVVFSTTRSVPRRQVESDPTKDWMQRHLGRLADKHQINVAVSRAREGLVIVGNKYLLKCQPMWEALLTHYRELNKLVDAADFLQTIT